MGDAGTTATILILVFILTVILGAILVLFELFGTAFALLGFVLSLLLIPFVIFSGIVFNIGFTYMIKRSKSFWTIPFIQISTPIYGQHNNYRKLYITQKLTTFGISIFIFIFSLIVSTVLFLIPPSVNPICLIALPISFPFMLITITMPAIAWMSFGYAFDPYEPEPRGYLVVALLWGMLSTFPSLFINTFNFIWMEPIGLDASVLSAPLFEEVFKALGFFLIFSQIKDETDGILYGILFGAGFALVENFLYGVNAIIAAGGMGFFLLIGFRSFFNMVIHMIGPVLIGIAFGWFRSLTLRERGNVKIVQVLPSDLLLPLISLPFIGIGIINHMLWNAMAGLGILCLPVLMMIGLFEFFLLLAMVIGAYSVATARFNRSGTD
ncbi:MAG: PrsW family glutamic-type intramembrane protease [Candidatus Thermoplasmatota archaeon]|nr:PrsW family glutamic-type intramembrane protease [Candidatus Thermoplasmatota archaeon]